MSTNRVLKIRYPKNDPNYRVFLTYVGMTDNQVGIKERNIIFDKEEWDRDYFKLDVIGYDGEVKMTLDEFKSDSFRKIFDEIDSMPMRQAEMARQTMMPDTTYTKVGGAKDSYYHKYLKYKAKYLKLVHS